MRTTISLPAELWRQLETLAVTMHITRGELCVLALQRYLQDHDKAQITTHINAYIDASGQPTDQVLSALALSNVRKIEW